MSTSGSSEISTKPSSVYDHPHEEVYELCGDCKEEPITDPQLPRCNLCQICMDEMCDQIDEYYDKMNDDVDYGLLSYDRQYEDESNEFHY